MKIKTLIASFSASFDDLVKKIENHEAVADCVIQEVRESAAKIRSQLSIVLARLEKQHQHESQLQKDSQRWKDRALSNKNEDEDKALRCMQAYKKSQSALANLRAQISENQHLAADLETHLCKVEQKLSEIQTKRESLSARSARNKVEKTALMNLDKESTYGIFERWETQVVADEYQHYDGGSYSAKADPLDQEFRKQEDRDELLAELHALEDGNGGEQNEHI